MTRFCTSPKLLGFERRFRSRNSEIGLRFAKRDWIDWLRTPLKRSPRFSLDVIASKGMLIRAILGSSVRWTGIEGLERILRRDETVTGNWHTFLKAGVKGVTKAKAWTRRCGMRSEAAE